MRRMDASRLAVTVMVVLVSLTTAACVRAQDAGSGTTTSQRMARGADPDWDIVAVRASDPASKEAGYRVSGRREIQLLRQTAEAMLMVGYGVHKKQIANAPEWMRTQEWDVKGVPDVAGEPDARQIRALVRKLLAERFGLKVHTEQRAMPVFALTLTKGGAKLAVSKDDPNALADENERENDGEAMLAFTNAPVSLLVTLLDFRTERPVVDQTGLPGRYDFQLKYMMDETRVPVGGNAAPGLFTAMEEQLGLKLKPVEAAADVVVIDNVAQPGAN